MNSKISSSSPSRTAVVLGFGFIYLAWGATFLGVKFALVDFPVFLMSGSRFFFAGLLLYLGVAFFDRAGFRRGTFREWRDAGAVGSLLLVFGIGAGNWAQQYVDSSFTAMVFGGLPLWIIFIDWIRPGGRAPTRGVAAGLLLGFVGIGLILAPAGGAVSAHIGINLLLLFASISWAGGAVLSRHLHSQGSPLLPVARQMIVAGAILLTAGWIHGDHLGVMRPSAWLGFGYLLFIGSLGGYPVYIWLMRIHEPAKAATIPYVNLVVAVFLGWSLGHETITLRLLIGTAIVLTSVATVLRANSPEAVPPGD